MRILNDGNDNVTILSSGFSVIAAAATGNEVLKELFMDLKVDELMITVLKEQKNETISSLYDAIRVLLTADDNRVVASQVSKLVVLISSVHCCKLQSVCLFAVAKEKKNWNLKPYR